MNETLHANLPLEVFRKPIHFSSKHYHFQQATLKAGRKTADSSPSNEEDRETQAELQVQIKRIRYLNPYLYYVTEDGYTFPTTLTDDYAPLHLMNMSHKVARVAVNKATGDLTYILSPKYSAADLIPWQYVVEKLRYNGNQDTHDLADTFENLMVGRKAWIETLDTDSTSLDVINSLREEPFSDTIPQLAEVRRWSDDIRSNFCVTNYIMNKPMQKMLGIQAETDSMMALHAGIKAPGFTSREDSIKFLKQYFKNYTKMVNEKFKSAIQENEIMRITRIDCTGTAFDIQMTCKFTRVEGKVAWLYSYHIGKAIQPENAQPSDKKLKLTLPQTYNAIELNYLRETREQAIHFGKKFGYVKHLRLDPPQHLVCRVKELQRDKKSDLQQESKM